MLRVLLICLALLSCAVYASDEMDALKEAAQQGHVMAQLGLGVMYYHGYGTSRDHTEAARWFHVAADQGNVEAQYGLGILYRFGEGLPEDHAEAMHWFRKAALQGHASAQFNLGAMYAYGEGVPKDAVQAYAWYSTAIAQDSEPARYFKGLLTKEMTREQIARGQELSHKYQEAYGPARESERLP